MMTSPSKTEGKKETDQTFRQAPVEGSTSSSSSSSSAIHFQRSETSPGRASPNTLDDLLDLLLFDEAPVEGSTSSSSLIASYNPFHLRQRSRTYDEAPVEGSTSSSSLIASFNPFHLRQRSRTYDEAIVDVAKEVGADAISHGCTGKGNDQVRLEHTFFAMNPKLNLVAPWREWDITCREDAIEYAKKHNVPVPVTKKSIYSRDRNLWHLSHEAPVKGLSSSSSAIHFQRSATFPARASRNALNGPLNFNPLHLTSGSVTDDEMIRADKLAYHRFLLGQLALVKGSTSSSSSSASYNPFRLRRQSRTYDEEHEVRKLSLGLERDLRHGRNEEDRAITILKKLVDFYRTGADLFFSANRETPNTGLPVSAPAQDSKNALVTFTTFLWGVLDIPSTIRPVLIFLFAGLLKGLSGDSISTFEFKSGITTKASESTLTLGEAIFAYESEIIQVVLYYICYSLSWMLILPLHHGMVIVLGILLIFAPMLFLPNLVRKASSTGVRVALGSSFNMSLTSFTLTAAFGFFLIFGLVAWLVLYFIWIFVRGRTPARGQDNEERRALWRLASLFDL